MTVTTAIGCICGISMYGSDVATVTTDETGAVALPDLTWQVSGLGQGRIARARVRGHAGVVRMVPINGQEMWLLDVDGQTGCARFRLRPDAMSKMGAAAALRACERRLAR